MALRLVEQGRGTIALRTLWHARWGWWSRPARPLHCRQGRCLRECHRQVRLRNGVADLLASKPSRVWQHGHRRRRKTHEEFLAVFVLLMRTGIVRSEGG